MASLRRIAHRPPWWLWLPVDFLILAILLASRTEESIEGVWTVDMGRECYLDYHTKIHAVALACPGVDYIKLWPLPVEQPWQETPVSRGVAG